MDKLSHFDGAGDPTMVDVSGKQPAARAASAEAKLLIKQAHAEALSALPKGDPFATAKIAGIQAAKRCSELIPLCHNVPLSYVDVHFQVEGTVIHVVAEAKTSAQTGVEMEAYTAAAVAGLTLIDMLKGVDPDLTLMDLRLVSKTGGKSDFSRQK
jgi:cyclic pyranopterin phosphate synthase